MASAVAAGAAKGVSGISVQLDGYTVGRLVAPYVSETVARDVIIG
jgi:phage-related protein